MVVLFFLFSNVPTNNLYRMTGLVAPISGDCDFSQHQPGWDGVGHCEIIHILMMFFCDRIL